jgi:hypothetical protein
MTTKRDGLKPVQERAIVELIAGKSISATAASIGVERQTLSRWINHDVEFQATLNQARADLWSGLQDQIRSVAGKAVALVEQQLDDPERSTGLALDVLKLLTRLDLAPTGSTNASKIEMDRMMQSIMYGDDGF